MKKNLDKAIIRKGFISGRVTLPITKDNNITYYCSVVSIGGKFKNHYFIKSSTNSSISNVKGKRYTESQLDKLLDKFINNNLWLIDDNSPIIKDLLKYNNIDNIINNL